MVRFHAARFRVAPTRELKQKRREMIMAQKTGIVKWFSARRGYELLLQMKKGNDFFSSTFLRKFRQRIPKIENRTGSYISNRGR